MYYYPEENFINSVSTSFIWTIVSLVVALIGGIALYFLVFKTNTQMPNPFLKKVKSFFNFENMLIEDILKVVYIILVIFITLNSFTLIASNFFAFLCMLILGNLVLNIMIWKNNNDINKKLKK